MELLTVLEKNKLCRGLNQAEVSIIAAQCSAREYAGGELIFKEKSPECGMYILVEGQVDIQMSMGDDDAPATVHVIHEGEVFGELSLVDRSPRSATAKAAGKAVTFLLDAAAFDAICEQQHRIGLVIMKNIALVVSARLRETNIRYMESLIWERLGS